METKNKIWKTFWLGIIFLTGGFLSGFLALILSVFIQYISGILFIYFALLVLAEEVSKLAFIVFLFDKIKTTSTALLINCALLGLGFVGFEFLLISLENSVKDPLLLAPLFIIHISTSVLLGLGIINLTKSRFIFAIFFLLAFLLHFTYNLTVINNFNLHF